MLLFVTNRKIGTEIPADPFPAAGIFCYFSTYKTALQTYRDKDVGAVVLDGIPSLDAAERLCRILRAEAPEMPVSLILSPDDCPDADADTLIRITSPAEIPSAVMRFCSELGSFSTILSSPYLAFDEPGNTVCLLGYPLKLSPSEYRLLRCLFYLAPRTVSSEDLIALAFPGQKLTSSALSVLISKINRKAQPLGADPLIRNRYAEGYRLSNAVFDL